MGKALASPRLMNNAGVESLGSSGAASLPRAGIRRGCRLGFFLFIIFVFQLSFGFWRQVLSAKGLGLEPPGNLGPG